MKTIVTLKGPVDTNGYATAARLHIDLLKTLTNDLTVIDVDNPNIRDAEIIYNHKFPAQTPPIYFRGKKVIAYWCVESSLANSEYAEHANFLTQIWTPSVQSANAIKAIVTDPNKVKVIPHPIALQPVIDRSGRSTFTILTAGAAPIGRKNFEQVYKVIRTAFPASTHPNVRWILKLRGVPSDKLNSIKSLLEEDTRFTLIHENYTKAQMEALYTQADCYFQLHKAGAFELHCAEAASYGLPVICTEFGGPVDYLPAASLVNCTLVENEALDKINKAGQWAQPSSANARTKLLNIYNDVTARNNLGAACRTKVRQTCRPSDITTLMLNAINELPATVSSAWPAAFKTYSQVPPGRSHGKLEFSTSPQENKILKVRPGFEIVGGIEPSVDSPIVASHRRSGTHHLGTFILRNWNKSWYKTHDFPERLGTHQKTLYVIRNPIDTLFSTYSWFKDGTGSANPLINTGLANFTFNQWISGQAGKTFGYDDFKYINTDNLTISRGMFYDPIGYWVSHVKSFIEAGHKIIVHEKLMKNPQQVGEEIAAHCFNNVVPQTWNSVTDLVGLNPSLNPIGGRLPEWSIENINELKSRLSSDILTAVGYSTLEDWITS